MTRWAQHGLPAGVSTVLAFLAGALTNVFTQGWSWPVGVGLGVLVFGWVGWEMRLAARAATAVSTATGAGVYGPAVPRQLPAAVRYFSGRGAELAVLTGQLTQSRVDGGGTVVISAIGGTAGVGETKS